MVAFVDPLMAACTIIAFSKLFIVTIFSACDSLPDTSSIKLFSGIICRLLAIPALSPASMPYPAASSPKCLSHYLHCRCCSHERACSTAWTCMLLIIVQLFLRYFSLFLPVRQIFLSALMSDSSFMATCRVFFYIFIWDMMCLHNSSGYNDCTHRPLSVRLLISIAGIDLSQLAINIPPSKPLLHLPCASIMDSP